MDQNPQASVLGVVQLINLSLIILIISLSAGIFFRNFFIAGNTYKAYEKDEEMAAAFDWINFNLPDNSVIMTPSIESNYWLIMKTKVYIFTPHALHSLAPTSELVERMSAAFGVFEASEDYVQEFFAHKQTLGTTPHTHKSLDTTGLPYLFYLKYGYKGLISKQAKNELAKSLKAFKTEDRSFKEIKSNYKVDYLFYGPSEKRISKSNFEENEGLKKVYDSGEVEIFKIN